MISLIEKLRAWATRDDRPHNAHLVSVLIYSDGKLVHSERRAALADTRSALLSVSNAIVSDALGRARREAKGRR